MGWDITSVQFDGYAPERSGAGHTAWQFTAVAGRRRFSVYLRVADRILTRFGGIAPGGPPPADLVPTLGAYVRTRLQHPLVAQRHPRSLEGVELGVSFKPEWDELRQSR